MVIVDTLQAVRKLQDSGMDESQAEAIVDIIQSSSTDIMTKNDAAVLRAEVKSEVVSIKAEVKSEISSLKAEVADVKAEVKSEVASIKAEVYRIKSEVYRVLWIQGIGIVAVMGTLFGIAVALG